MICNGKLSEQGKLQTREIYYECVNWHYISTDIIPNVAPSFQTDLQIINRNMLLLLKGCGYCYK